ncbi:hypothetical protein N9L68_04740 [bacterium]|nr:hypothetical protein [bacterium]
MPPFLAETLNGETQEWETVLKSLLNYLPEMCSKQYSHALHAYQLGQSLAKTEKTMPGVEGLQSVDISNRVVHEQMSGLERKIAVAKGALLKTTSSAHDKHMANANHVMEFCALRNIEIATTISDMCATHVMSSLGDLKASAKQAKASDTWMEKAKPDVKWPKLVAFASDTITTIDFVTLTMLADQATEATYHYAISASMCQWSVCVRFCLLPNWCG